MFVSNNPTSFHLWWKKNLVKNQIVSKYEENDRLQIFFFSLFMSSLTRYTSLKQPYLCYNLLCLFKKRTKTNWNCFKYQISTTVKISVKQLPSKAKFSTLLQVNCSNFWLKHCGSSKSYQNCQINYVSIV